MRVITYSLRDGATPSDQYYSDVARFADEVVAHGRTQYPALVNAVIEMEGESPRTPAEILYEFLTLGALWRTYAADALALGEMPRQALTRLVQLREREARLKPSADWLRGVLSTLFLSSHGGPVALQPTIQHLDRLLGWLAATGAFDEEVKRLTNWRDFLIRQSSEQAAATLAAALAFAGWFEQRSEETLGRYTPNVERFLAEEYSRYRWRADARLCGRRRVEYHLQMLGTEILNRSFRDEFRKTSRKIVLVPPCMCFQPAGQCQARASTFGAQCAHCTPQCHVHQITQLGLKYHFPVFILPDDLRVFSTGTTQTVPRDNLGIVGISCVLTNAAGGWQMKRLHVPAQGLPLDYCGCSWHWDKDGMPTDVNFNQLLYLVGIDKENQQ